ncbi:MAG: helix-turn-helix transcriptional regulator [bacterium]
MKRTILLAFAKRVRAERKKLGLSQEDFADKADFHRTYIGMIERAERNITLANIEKLAKALRIPISALLKGL